MTDAIHSTRICRKQLKNIKRWLKQNCKHVWEPVTADKYCIPGAQFLLSSGITAVNIRQPQILAGSVPYICIAICAKTFYILLCCSPQSDSISVHFMHTVRITKTTYVEKDLPCQNDLAAHDQRSIGSFD
jgi:hypothetical protein